MNNKKLLYKDEDILPVNCYTIIDKNYMIHTIQFTIATPISPVWKDQD